MCILSNKSEAQVGNNFIQCRYIQHITLDYTCLLDNLTHLNELATVFISGIHMQGRNNNDVRSIRIINSRTPFIIQQLFTTFSQATTFEIEDSRLDRISQSAFQQAGNLQVIRITSNPIRIIEAGVFRNLNRLRILDLNRNQFNNLQETLFDGLSNLEELDLGFNRIFNFTSNTFRSLTRLETLNFGFNNLTHIAGDSFQNNRNLRTLMLRNNQIHAIQSSFMNHLNNISVLMFASNRCVDQTFQRPSNWNLTEGLRNCFNNWSGAPEVPNPEIPADFRKYVLFLRGDLIVVDENGQVVSQLSG